MASTIANVVLAVTAILFYANGNLFAAGIFALWTLYRVLQGRISRLVQVLSRIGLDVPSEQGCNTAIEARIVVSNVLTHSSVKAAFVKLKGNGIIQANTFEEWIETLEENYKRKYGRDENSVEPVRFNLKSGLLFKNGELDFGDVIYHDIEIPYVEGQERKSFMTPELHVQLAIRLMMVNGMLVVQVGRFDKDTTPNLLKDGYLAVYETWATITSFPFLYFSHRHGLPVRYLNLSSHATKSFKAHHAERGSTKGMWNDWEKLHKDLRDYRILCDSDAYSYSKWKKLNDAFEVKRNELLKAEGFQTLRTRDADESWRYPDSGEEYSNEFLWVAFRDINLNRDYGAEHWFTDYYEEMP